MLESVLNEYAFNLDYAGLLVADVPDELMCRSGGAGHENHPAFTLGHLVIGSAIAAEILGLERGVPDGWAELFERQGPTDRRLPPDDPGLYPPKGELLEELGRQHKRVAAAIKAADAATLDRPHEWRMDRWMPNVAGVLTFLCTAHEAMHIGQLAAWRRAMGLPSALTPGPA